MFANKKTINKPVFKPKIPYIMVLGVKVHLGHKPALQKAVFDRSSHNKQYQISTPNPEQVVLAQTNQAFLQALNQSDLNIPDGAGLVWAVNRLYPGTKLARIAGIDLMTALCCLAGRHRRRVFLLGGKNETAKTAAMVLAKQYPGIIIDSFSGAKDIANETITEHRQVIAQINRFAPHFLFVAYGAPYQELWIAANKPNLKAGVIMSVGGAFDYMAGTVKRAPVWAQRLGLEWFFRLCRQPYRLKRQLRLIKFVRLVLAEQKKAGYPKKT